MTDEEQAMTQFKNTFCTTCEDKEICDISILDCTAYDSIYKQAYLAVLKAGRPKWHKVADGEYPPCENDNYSINVLTDSGNIAYYNYDEECWISEPASVEIDPPIAWCEIPTFTDKE